MKLGLFGFLLAMWVLIIVGGGIVVVILGPMTVSEFGHLNWFVASAIKSSSAIILVVTWIYILSKIKNLIFKKAIRY